MGNSSPTLHVLLIEDNPGDAFLVREMLDGSASDNVSMANLVHVQTLAEAVAMLHTRPTPPLDIILLDLSLPDAQGVDGIQKLAEEGRQVPVVVLTGNDDGDLAFEALEAGAQDYLHKDDISPASLHRSLRYAHERHRHALEVLAAQRQQQALQVQIEGERLIRRLVTDIQHEFRTPLAIIQSSALVLARATAVGNEGIDHERIYERIEKAIKRLVQILDYMSKIAEITAVVDATKATASLDKAINEVRHRQGAAGKRLHCNLNGHFDVLIDHENLVELLSRIVENGLQYAPDHTAVTMTVQQAADAPENMVTITIADRGPGIAASELDNIFRPFYKLEPSRTKRGQEGPGLGLTIANMITRYYGGRIEVQSEVGEGCTVTVFLRRAP